MKILGLSGSLRQRSHNRFLLQQLGLHAAKDVHVDIFQSVAEVPVFNEDLEGAATPASVLALWRAIGVADGILFATPEYNQALPGSTKNLVDWISRAPGESLLSGKPVAVIGATIGTWGTRIAQQQLRTVLSTLGAAVMPSPSLFVAKAGDFDFASEALAVFNSAFTVWVKSRPRACK